MPPVAAPDKSWCRKTNARSRGFSVAEIGTTNGFVSGNHPKPSPPMTIRTSLQQIGVIGEIESEAGICSTSSMLMPLIRA